MAAAAQDFRAVITVVDRATAPLRTIAGTVAQVNGAIEGSARRVLTVTEPMRSGSLVSGIGSAAAAAASSIAGLGSAMSGLLAPVVALGSLASLGGLLTVMQAAADRATTLASVWARLGATTQARRVSFEDLAYSAQLAGKTAEEAASGLATLQRAIAEAATNRQSPAAQMFHQLRINLRDGNRQLRTAIDLLPQMARALHLNRNPVVRQRILETGFGGDALEGAISGLDAAAARRRAQAFAEPSAEQTDGLNRFGQSWRDVGKAIQQVQDAIGGRLAPILTPLVDQMVRWANTNRDWIATGITAAVEGMVNALKAIPWESLVAGWNRMTGALGAASDAVENTRIGMWLLAGVIGTPLVAALTAATVATVAFTAAFALNPITLAVAALAATVYAVAQDWEHTGPQIMAVWERIRSAAAPLIEAARDLGHWLGEAATTVWVEWQYAGGNLRAVWTLLAGAAGRGVAAIGDAVAGLTEPLWRPVLNAWNAVADFFETWFRRIRAAWDIFVGAFNATPLVRQLNLMIDSLRIVVELVERAYRVMNQPWQSGPGFGPDAQRERGSAWRNRGSLYQPQSYDGAAPGGGLDLRVTFENAPPGTRVDATPRGGNITAQLNVGYAFSGTAWG